MRVIARVFSTLGFLGSAFLFISQGANLQKVSVLLTSIALRVWLIEEE